MRIELRYRRQTNHNQTGLSPVGSPCRGDRKEEQEKNRKRVISMLYHEITNQLLIPGKLYLIISPEDRKITTRSGGKKDGRGEYRSDDMSGNVPGDHPVAVTAVQPLWQHPESAPDGFIGIGDTAGIRAADEPLDQVRYLDAFLLADLEIPDYIDGCAGGNKGDPIHLLF